MAPEHAALDRLSIEQLVLRLPGLSREEARALAEEVALRLARTLPGLDSAQIPARLVLRLRLAPGASRGALASEIAAAIAGALA